MGPGFFARAVCAGYFSASQRRAVEEDDRKTATSTSWMAARRFSGTWSEDNYRRNEAMVEVVAGDDAGQP